MKVLEILEPKIRSENNSKAYIVKNDRAYNRWPREPMARSDTVSESFAQLTCHCEQRHCLPADRRDLPMRSNPKVLRKDCFDKKRLAMTEWRDLPAACPPSFSTAVVLAVWRSYLTGSSPPLCKPPTGFSDPDVGGPPDVECDVGLMLDNSMSSLKTFRRSKGFSDEPPARPAGGSEGHKTELETTRLTDDEVCDGCCLAMDSTRFQLCQN
jgi:hypothetical protein